MALLEGRIHVDHPCARLFPAGVRMEDFPIGAAAIKPKDALMWIFQPATGFYHPLNGFQRVSRVAAGFVLASGRNETVTVELPGETACELGLPPSKP